MRKFVQRSGLAGLAVLVLACGAVIAVRQPNSHSLKAVASVFPAPAPAAEDPVLLAAITRGGPPLPSPRVETARAVRKTAPLYQTIDLDTGPAADGPDPVSRQQPSTAVTENAASPVGPETQSVPAAD